MIYTNETLYVNLDNNTDSFEVDKIREKMFNIIDEYEVENVVLNTKDLFNKNKKIIGTLRSDYYKHYKGNLTINNK